MLMKKTFAYFISIIVVGGTTASSGIQPSPALKGGEEERIVTARLTQISATRLVPPAGVV